MPGRILIVDSQPTTRALLRVKLTVAYYETEQAESLEEAVRLARVFRPDIVIFSDTLAGTGPARVVARMASLLPGEEIRSIFLQSDPCPEARRAAIEAGVEDVIVLPLNHRFLLARLRSIFRKLDTDRDARWREDADRALGLSEAALPYLPPSVVTLVHSDPAQIPRRVIEPLEAAGQGRLVLITPQEILRDNPPPADLYMLFDTPETAGEMLSLVSELRAHGRTRRAGVIYGALPEDTGTAASALDLGADDVVLGWRSAKELVVRSDRLIARRRAVDAHRLRMQTGLRAALIDPLTGLWNRRYALPNLEQLVETASLGGRQVAVMLADLDHFKTVNDQHGHLIGDAVLKEVARRLQLHLRSTDMLARFGGEEFLVILPETDCARAATTAQRLIDAVSATPIEVCDAGLEISVSISIGIAVGPQSLSGHGASGGAAHGPAPGAELLAAADRALYSAKRDGRACSRVASTGAGEAADTASASDDPEIAIASPVTTNSDSAPSGRTDAAPDQRQRDFSKAASKRSA